MAHFLWLQEELFFLLLQVQPKVYFPGGNFSVSKMIRILFLQWRNDSNTFSVVFNSNNNEILTKDKPLEYTRAWLAVQKNNQQLFFFFNLS